MTKLLLLALLSLVAAAPASAASLALNLTNNSGDAINIVTATPKGATETSTQNVLASPIPNDEPGDAAIEAAEGTCVFDLTFTLASGKTISTPNTDICQTDTIVVE